MRSPAERPDVLSNRKSWSWWVHRRRNTDKGRRLFDVREPRRKSRIHWNERVRNGGGRGKSKSRGEFFLEIFAKMQ